MSVLLTLSAGPLACMLLPTQLHQPRTVVRMSTSDNMRDVIAATEKGVKAQLAFRARGQELGLLKAKGESTEHVLMKALLWALFLPTAPDALAEVQVGHRYRPDVVALSEAGTPYWWGECGSVTSDKLCDLHASFPSMRLTIAKWGHSDLSGYAAQLRQALPAVPEGAAPRIDLVSFPEDSASRFVADDGSLSVTWETVQTQQVELRVKKGKR